MKVILKATILIIFLTCLSLLVKEPVLASAFNTRQLTNNNLDDYDPQISGNNVIWESIFEGRAPEIFLYDGATTIQLTDNNSREEGPRISGNNVVWMDKVGGFDWELLFYNGTTTIQLTDNDYEDMWPQISGGNVAWRGWDGRTGNDYETLFYNGTTTIQLTDNNYSDWYQQISGNNVIWAGKAGFFYQIFFYNGTTTTQLTDNDNASEYPQISGNNVVWKTRGVNGGIFFYNGATTIQLADYNDMATEPQISGNNVVWMGHDGTDWEIFFYNGDTTTQLTDNNYYDGFPQISGNNVAWMGSDSTDSEIFFYDSATTTKLTDNDYEDIWPQISGNNVVWKGHDGTDWEIFLYGESEPTLPLPTPKLSLKVNTYDNFLTKFSWNAQGIYQDSYEFEIWTASGGEGQLVDQQSGTTEKSIERTLNQLVVGSTYFARVRVSDGSGWTNWAEASFKVDKGASNPYDVWTGQWYLVQMHDHYYPDDPVSIRIRNTSPELFFSIYSPWQTRWDYRLRGYDYVFMTEHNELIDGSEENGDVTKAIGSKHIGVFGALGHANEKQGLPNTLKDIRNLGGYPVANHPNSKVDYYDFRYGEEITRNDYSWSVGELGNLQYGEAMEIFTNAVNWLDNFGHYEGYGLATDKWDILLGQRRKIWGTATDDYTPFLTPIDGGAVWVKADSPNRFSLLSAIRRGSFFSTTGSNGPVFTDIKISDDSVITVTTPKPADITFKGGGVNNILDEDLNTTIGVYQVKGNPIFVRIELRTSNGTAWSNPIFVGKQASQTTSYTGRGFSGFASAAVTTGTIDSTPTIISFEETTLTIPPQVDTQTISQEIINIDDYPSDTPPWGYLSDVYKFSTETLSFSPEATLTISYGYEDTSMIGEDYIFIYKHNSATGLWERLTTVVDKNKKNASAKISSLGTYALSADIGVDITPPVVNILSPTETDTITGLTPVVATATDERGIYTTKLYLDHIYLGEDTSTLDGVNMFVDFSQFAVGEHDLRVVAEDASGNIGEDIVPISIFSTVLPLEIDITSPTPLEIVESSVTLEGTISSGVSRVIITVDDLLSSDITISVPGSFSQVLDTSYLDEGTHTISTFAFDEASNIATDSVTISVLKDTTAPETSITDKPPLFNKGDVSLSFEGVDDRSSSDFIAYYYKLDGVDSTYTLDTTTSVNYSSLADGSYTFRVKAIDWVGNIDESEATYSFSVDATKPSDPTTVSSPSHNTNEWSSNNDIRIDFSGATDTISGIDGYSVSWSKDSTETPDTTIDLQEDATSTTSGALADGNWYFNLRTRDNAGNWTSTVHHGPFWIGNSDLVITSITPSKLNPTTGEVISVDVVVSNEGTASASAFDVTLFNDPLASPLIGDPGSFPPDKSLGSAGIAAGASETLTFISISWPTIGKKDLYAIVDTANDIAESNEDNNVFGPVVANVYDNKLDVINSWDSGPNNWSLSASKSASGDFDGDGRDDIAVVYGYKTERDVLIYVFKGKSDGTFAAPVKWWQAGAGNWDWDGSKLTAGDYDNDGKDDLAIMYGYKTERDVIVFVFKSAGNKFNNPTNWFHAGRNNWDWDGSKLVTGDFNGDGKDDLAVLYGYQTERDVIAFVFTSTGSKFSSPRSWFHAGRNNWDWAGSKLAAGDFNGDGKDDLVILYGYQTERDVIAFVFTSQGSSFSSPRNNWQAGRGNWDWAGSKLVPGDYNGDGKDDLAIFYGYGSSRSAVFVFLSNGRTLSNNGIWYISPVGGWNAGNTKIFSGNFDGDGIDNLAGVYGLGTSQVRLFMIR